MTRLRRAKRRKRTIKKDLITFDEAIDDSKSCRKRHLLLGNGFSIACKPDIFTYGSIFNNTDFTRYPEILDVFNTLGTTDFERVIRTLDEASRVITIYNGHAETKIASKIATHAADLKQIFVESLVRNHPETPGAISAERYRHCRIFLSHFLGDEGSKGQVYTLNYDLLLYWTLMQDDYISGGNIVLEKRDGFGRVDPDDFGEWDLDWENRPLVWKGETSYTQKVHYLHGALHLFDSGSELLKHSWTDTGIPLRKQAQDAIEQNAFPLFVAEGESKDKLDKIKHSAYLYHSYKSFSRQMAQRDDALFIFGHSIADNDQHVLGKIVRGGIKRLYISIYGSLSDESNQQVIRNIKRLKQARNSLRIRLFSAESAHVWE